ncbi:MAG: type II toxin-antitoxin system VapC family toxin [Bryobacterales bacterium]|nr:type II toxin-antitoxin system VapC family toxin [Bryobacterales bacterium]
MIVIDASLLVEMLLNRPLAAAVRERLAQCAEPIAIPHIIDIEAISALRGIAKAERISSDRQEAFLMNLALFPAERYQHTPLLPRIWELRHNFTSHDAAYIALAEALDAELYTSDRRLARGHRARVRIFA